VTQDIHSSGGTAAEPFRLTAEQYAALHAMAQADRALMLATLAQAHHHRTFNIVGKYCSLDGIPQLREWDRRGEELTAQATDEYQRLAEPPECGRVLRKAA
jgi:hypothetical protein